MRHVLLDVAASVPDLDADMLATALDDGRARQLVVEQWRAASDGPVKGSPHLFFRDGTDLANPGITMHWQGDHGSGFPVIDEYDPSIYETVLERAAG
jgi:hypothetical protein